MGVTVRRVLLASRADRAMAYLVSISFNAFVSFDTLRTTSRVRSRLA
jgi:hypothetical protein